MLLIGSKHLGLRALEVMSESPGRRLVGAVTIDDQSDTRTEFRAITELCRARGIPLTVAGNRADARAAITALSPTVAVVANWYWVIDGDLTDRIRFVGLHNSLLPAYRGSSPLVWAMLRGEREVGVSLFSLAAGVDAGPIWGQARVPLHGDEYVGDVTMRLEAAGLALLREHLGAIADGTADPVPQDPSGATYCARRGPADGLIDWSRSAREVYAAVRAQSRPYPGAFSYLGGERLTIWRANVLETPYFGIPGQLVPEGVICGDERVLDLVEVELGGVSGPRDDVLSSKFGRLANAPRVERDP